MSITSITERIDSNRANLDTFEDRFVRSFHVHVNASGIDEKKISLHPSVPQYGDPHPRYQASRVIDVQINPEPRAYGTDSTSAGYYGLWYVDVTYSNLEARPDIRDRDPLNRSRRTIRWAFQNTQEPTHIDYLGKAITNSAGELFDPPFERDVTRPIAFIEELRVNIEAKLIDYDNKINSDTFDLDGLQIGPHSAKFQGLTIENAYEAGQALNLVRYELHFRFAPPNWDVAPVDIGYTHLIDTQTGQASVHARTADGEQQRTRILLDGAGKPLEFKGTPINLGPIQIYQDRRFAPLFE